MKKSRLQILGTGLVSGLLCLSLSVPVFAAETLESYREKANTLKTEITAIDEEIKPLQEEIKAASAAYRTASKTYRESKGETGDKESIQAAKELHKTLPDTENYKDDETSIKVLRQQAKSAKDNENYDEALSILTGIKERKQARLNALKEIQPTWAQISALLGE